MSDQFYVDGVVNVPDDKGDVGRIVYSRDDPGGRYETVRQLCAGVRAHSIPDPLSCRWG